MQVIAKTNGRWIELEVASYTVQALVFGEPSEEYGINGGCISKLWIRQGDTVVYNYDRGLDFSNISDDELEMIIMICETIDQNKLTKRMQRIELF
jgi:hypothetical protein